MEKKKIRIFISSPGDVQQERNIARNVISELNEIYSQYVKLEVLMWEDFPLSADSTFQEGINYFLNEDVIDIAVFILWSRLGTPLCNKFKKQDGSYYKSGTEYEFDMMMQLFSDKGWPRILAYVKNAEFKPNVSNLKELEEILRQKDNVESFIHEYFRDDDNNANYAYLQFGDGSSFEHKFRTHLTNTIKNIIGDIGEIREWDGNPYVGLNSFEYEQNSIFFGRKQLVYETATKLVDFNDTKKKNSLIVLGESGSGKSSFIKAGLLPFLCKDKSGDDYIIVNPSMYGGNFYNGLLDLLLEKFSFLKDNPFVEELRAKIDDSTNFKHLSFALSQHQHNNVIIYIDQFEELFSDNQMSEEERLRVILLIKGLVSTKSIGVYMSMRSDYYNYFSQYGCLAQLKELCVVIDVPIVGLSEIKDIVEEPAKKACLKWEIDDKANVLHKLVVKEAMAIRELPLIEFALSELYNMRDENDCLTFEAYNKIGGMKGAIVSYANSFYASLSQEEKEALSIVLSFVIASSEKNDTCVRKTSLMKDVCSTKVQKQLVKKLIDAHLLVAGKDSGGQSTVTIVHETLIKHWSVVQEWIEQQKDFLKTSAYYEQRAKHWVNNARSAYNLISEKTALLEGEYFLYKYSKQVSKEVKDFLLASMKKERRKGIVWQTMLGSFLLLGIITIVLIKLLGIEYPPEVSEWFGGINDLSLPEYLLAILPCVSIMVHSLFLRYYAKPKFQTIKYSLIFWIVFFICFLVDDVFISKDISDPLTIFIDACILIVLVSAWLDYRKRRLWKKKKSVNFSFSEKWVRRIESVFYIIVIIILFLYYSYILGEANETIEKNEKLLETNSEMFNMYNHVVTSVLSPEDNISVNNIWSEHLKENYMDELRDTVPDDMEFQYATCLYNLKEPEEAYKYLYWKSNWRDFLFMIYCMLQCGKYEIAEDLLDLYVEVNEYDNFYWLKTEDLIWIAEKLGRFDLAERLYEIIQEREVDMSDPAYVINEAHIHMYNGDIENAVKLYRQGVVYSSKLKDAIEQDLHTFSYFSSVDNVKLQRIADLLDLSFIPSYTLVDSVTTANMYDKLQGDWLWQVKEDAEVVKWTINSGMQMARHHSYVMSNGECREIDRFVLLLRFEDTNRGLLCDYYRPDNDENSYGRILEYSEDYFVLEIIENGNPEDKGEIRRFERLK